MIVSSRSRIIALLCSGLVGGRQEPEPADGSRASACAASPTIRAARAGRARRAAARTPSRRRPAQRVRAHGKRIERTHG